MTSGNMQNLNELAQQVHQTAVEHGWWECATCGGLGGIPTVSEYNETCPTCKGTGKHRNTAELLALVHSEVSEALEALRKPELDAICDKCVDGYKTGYPVGLAPKCRKCNGTGGALAGSRFAEELADVVIRVLDIAAGHGIDIEAAVAEKHAYNVTRPHKHGGKAF